MADLGQARLRSELELEQKVSGGGMCVCCGEVGGWLCGVPCSLSTLLQSHPGMGEALVIPLNVYTVWSKIINCSFVGLTLWKEHVCEGSEEFVLA